MENRKTRKIEWLTATQIARQEHIPETTLARWRDKGVVDYKAVSRTTNEDLTENYKDGKLDRGSFKLLYNRQQVHDFNINRDIPRNWISVDEAVILSKNYIEGGIKRHKIMNMYREGLIQGKGSYRRSQNVYINPNSLKNAIENIQLSETKGAGNIDCSKSYKLINGFDYLYGVSDDGTVINCNTKNVIGQTPQDDGYMHVTFIMNGEEVSFPVHQLVAQLYCPNPFWNRDAHHINCNKHDNRASNLICLDRHTHQSLHAKYLRKMAKMNKSSEAYKELNKAYKAEIKRLKHNNLQYVAIPVRDMGVLTDSHVYLVLSKDSEKVRKLIRERKPFGQYVQKLWANVNHGRSIFDIEQQTQKLLRVKRWGKSLHE